MEYQMALGNFSINRTKLYNQAITRMEKKKDSGNILMIMVKKPMKVTIAKVKKWEIGIILIDWAKRKRLKKIKLTKFLI
jgi:hypothetical protein